MIIVLDANVLFSALLGSRKTIEFLIKSDNEFYAPEFVVIEVRKYKTTVREKATITEADFNAALEALLKFITLVDEQEYKEHLIKAKKAMQTSDQKDAPYIACALALKADIVCTNDKHFAAQTLVKTKTTKQVTSDN